MRECYNEVQKHVEAKRVESEKATVEAASDDAVIAKAENLLRSVRSTSKQTAFLLYTFPLTAESKFTTKGILSFSVKKLMDTKALDRDEWDKTIATIQEGLETMAGVQKTNKKKRQKVN